MKNCIFLLYALMFSVLAASAQDFPAGEQEASQASEEPEVATEFIPEIEEEEPEVEADTLVEPLWLAFPEEAGWNLLREGEKVEFYVKAGGGTDSIFSVHLEQGSIEGMEFDSLGMFSWTPDYDFVHRLSNDTTIQLLFKVSNRNGEEISKIADLSVQHVNRPPLVGELKPLYVRYNTTNTYKIESLVVRDEDEDPIAFIPIVDVMPEGAQLTAQGEFSWKPSLTQFNYLRDNPLELEFYVEDQPCKARTKGHFMIKVTQQDEPPSMQMVPSQKRFVYKEDATINLKFQLYDPNGENDIASFNFISDNPNIPADALVKNTDTQYEFIWRPGYDFVKDPLDSLALNVTFFVVDRSNKPEERSVRFTILNTVNEAEWDQKLYAEYRAALVRAWDLMEQLKETEKDLKKKYRKARRGKKTRSLTNASLGAATGIGPVVVEEPATSKKITAIGGTAVMTIGTLEATEVFGRSTKDLVERLNYIIEKRNELQTKGDIFARKYALKSSRRKSEFMKDVDELIIVMNLKGLVALELDAGWKNKQKATNENIARTFKDFNPGK